MVKIFNNKTSYKNKKNAISFMLIIIYFLLTNCIVYLIIFKFLEAKLRNTHLLIDNNGEIAETYHKIHLYDVEIPSKNVKAFESSLIEAGNEISPPVKTPIGNVGLAIVSFLIHILLSITK